MYNKNLLVISSTLILSKALDRFNETREEFAIILNNYDLITLTAMGNNIVEFR